jgi:hypothetical protein
MMDWRNSSGTAADQLLTQSDIGRDQTEGMEKRSVVRQNPTLW